MFFPLSIDTYTYLNENESTYATSSPRRIISKTQILAENMQQ